MTTDRDAHFMGLALRLAEAAAHADETPIGALVVCGGRVVGKGDNQMRRLNDPTAHAEMLALTAAFDALQSRYLRRCTLYVTLEPCAMCAGALRWAQLGRLVYGADDEKFGYRVFNAAILHPKTVVLSGIFADESRALLKDFFRQKRGP